MGPVDTKPPFLEADHEFIKGIRPGALHFTNTVTKNIQGPPGGDLWVKLSEGAGSGISGIGKGRQALLKSVLIQFLKGLGFHINLSPDFQEIGKRLSIGKLFKAQGDGHDGLDVGGDVFTQEPIPPGGGHGQTAFFVNEFHCQAVHFGLDRVFQGVFAPQKTFEPGIKIQDAGFIKGVFKAQHGLAMADLGEGSPGLGTHPLAWRIRGNQIGVFLFQFQQPLKQPVIGGIGYIRIIQGIVAAVVVSNLFPEFVQFLLNMFRLFRHSKGPRIPYPSLIPYAGK